MTSRPRAASLAVLAPIFAIVGLPGCHARPVEHFPAYPFEIRLHEGVCCEMDGDDDVKPKVGRAVVDTFHLYINPADGYIGMVRLSPAGGGSRALPKGMRLAFDPPVVRVNNAPENATLRVTVDASVPFGCYQFGVRGTDGKGLSVASYEIYQLNVYQPPSDSRPNLYINGDPAFAVDGIPAFEEDPFGSPMDSNELPVTLHGVRDKRAVVTLKVVDDPSNPLSKQGAKVTITPASVTTAHPSATLKLHCSSLKVGEYHVKLIGTTRDGRRLVTPVSIIVPEIHAA